MHGLIPTIRGLVFICSSHGHVSTVGRLRNAALPVHCVVGHRYRHPVVVPSSRVHDFVTVSKGRSRTLLCLSPSRPTLHGKAHMHVVNNIFTNIRNRFIHIEGSHHIIMSVSKIVTITAAFVRPSLIRPVVRGWSLVCRFVEV